MIEPGTPSEAPDAPAERDRLREVRARAEARGYASGRARAEAELRNAIDAAGAMAAQIEALAPTESGSIARAIALLSTAIARRIVDAELRVDPTILVRALEAAVTMINGSPEAHVLVHPDQLALVRTAWESTHGNVYLGKRWTFEADITLPPGGCVLRYEHGLVSLGIESQVDEIANAIADVVPGLRAGRALDAIEDQP